MRRRLIIALLVALASPCLASQGDELRSGFIISRKKAASSSSRAKSKRTAKATKTPDGALALGYTLYSRDRAGSAVRVDPARSLKDGDRVRLMLETNEDCYLYIFNTDDRGARPVMIYPDARLNGGSNRINAHVPQEIPSASGSDPSLRWLSLENGPVTDQLFIVVSREPLAGVPVGAALECADAECLWSPDSKTWLSVNDAANVQLLTSVAATFGTRQTPGEANAALRSVRLRAEAPAPSVVRSHATASASTLVTRIDIRHSGSQSPNSDR